MSRNHRIRPTPIHKKVEIKRKRFLNNSVGVKAKKMKWWMKKVD